MSLVIQKSEFEKGLVNAGVDLIKKEKAGEVKWEAVTFYLKRAQRLTDEYERLVSESSSVASEEAPELDKDIKARKAGYQLFQVEKEAWELLKSVKSKTDQLEALMA